MDKDKCDCSGDCCCEGGDKKWWKHKKNWKGGGGSGGAIYCLGLIGALFYFLPKVTNFWEAILAIIKSVGWPGLVVFKTLELLRF